MMKRAKEKIQGALILYCIFVGVISPIHYLLCGAALKLSFLDCVGIDALTGIAIAIALVAMFKAFSLLDGE